MANYLESNISGTEYKRARFLQIANDRNTTPNILIFEERVISFGDQTIGQDADRLSATFNPSATFPEIDIDTGEPTDNTFSHQDLYIILHSLYRDLAAKRDATVAVPPPPVE